MDVAKRSSHWIKLIFILLMVMLSHSIECPKKCRRCNVTIFDCPSADFTPIPKGIPLTVRYINLSDNPLLPITRSYFLKFKNLQTLLLNNANQTGFIDLPTSLKSFDFTYGKITIESLRLMLSKLHSLESLVMKWTYLNITGICRILPRGIKYLTLDGNNLPSLGRDDLKYCTNLIEFQCDSCSLKVIEPSVFDCVGNITHIVLSNNKLVDLPDRLFQNLKTLSMLDMTGNKLEQFNASKLGLKHVHFLVLRFNRITSIDLQHSHIISISLGNNRIRKLDATSFGSNPIVYEASFERNRIREISERAFQNIRAILHIVLYGNNIENLPASLLSNTSVYTLFLHNNSLSSVDEFLLGMKRLPHVLTLYLNKKMKSLNTSVFRGINMHHKVYVSCNELKNITLSSQKKFLIECYPSPTLTICTQTRVLRYDGYECQWIAEHQYFRCTTCQLGFYDETDAKSRITSDCLPCPAGSFYQDELASLSCKNCPLGQYVPPSRSPGKDASDCRTCPLGTNTSQLAGTRACRCLQGYYRQHRFGECNRCRHAGFECIRDYPQLKQGYWMTWNGTDLSNRSCKHEFQSYILNLETVNNSYDRNTMHFNCQLPIPIKCPMRGSCKGGIDSSCSSGYTGVLCGVCSQGYIRNFNRCVKCPQLYVIILRWAGLATLFILLCYIVSDKKDDSRRIRWMSRTNDESNRTIVDIFISSFKILIGFYQTLIGVMNAYNNINWPTNLVAIISIMEYIQFEVIRIPPLRCINPMWAMDAVKEFWISLIVFFTFPILCLICFLVRSCCLHYYETSELCTKRRRNLYARNCVRIAALFVFITYPLMSARVSYILPASCDSVCTVVHKGMCRHTISFLRSDYSLNCPTMSTDKYTLAVAYSFFTILCGLPLALWIVLRQSLYIVQTSVSSGSSRQCVTTHRGDGMEGVSLQTVCDKTNSIDPLITDDRSMDTPLVLKGALRFTYENYKAKFWYWEVIEMARKLIMTTGAALFLHHTKIGLSILIIVGIAFAILHAIKKPIKDDFENFLQMLSLWIIPVNLSAGAVIQSSAVGMNGRRGNDPESWKVGMFLIVINSLLIALVVGRFAKLGVEKLIARVA